MGDDMIEWCVLCPRTIPFHPMWKFHNKPRAYSGNATVSSVGQIENHAVAIITINAFPIAALQNNCNLSRPRLKIPISTNRICRQHRLVNLSYSRSASNRHLVDTHKSHVSTSLISIRRVIFGSQDVNVARIQFVFPTNCVCWPRNNELLMIYQTSSSRSEIASGRKRIEIERESEWVSELQTLLLLAQHPE